MRCHVYYIKFNKYGRASFENISPPILQCCLILIAPLCTLEIRPDVRVHSLHEPCPERGFAYGFSFNAHSASRERKARSRSRKVIFPLALPNWREKEIEIEGEREKDREKEKELAETLPFQLGGSSIESRAFLLFIWRRRAHDARERI